MTDAAKAEIVALIQAYHRFAAAGPEVDAVERWHAMSQLQWRLEEHPPVRLGGRIYLAKSGTVVVIDLSRVVDLGGD